MHILFLDPFHGGSHAAVATGVATHSRHTITLLTLSTAGGWRWRMRGAAPTLARRLNEGMPDAQFDLIVSTDMLDLATFLGLTRARTHSIPTAIYFHENQLTYPLPAGRTRDLSFPWINYTSALAADAVLFNSDFHRRTFLAALPALPGRYHDHQELDLIARIADRAHVLPPGIDLARLDAYRPADDLPQNDPPVILWNSRWDYDKQPQAFFDALAALVARGVVFRLIVAGEHVDPRAAEFVAARERFTQQTLSWGYVPSIEEYARLLWRADIVVSTAIQEFFGIGLVEAMYCGCVPILPRRLNYPDLLPPEHHAICLYDTDDQLVERLIMAIERLDELRQRDFRRIAAQYDWKAMAPRYDALFEQIAGGGTARPPGAP